MPKRKTDVSPDYPRDPAQVYRDWKTGLQIMGETGVRVFHDYLRLRSTSSATVREALLELGNALLPSEPYITLGRYIHVTARKNRRARIKYE